MHRLRALRFQLREWSDTSAPSQRKDGSPRDRQSMYQKIMLDRFGPLRTVAKTARVVLGMKL